MTTLSQPTIRCCVAKVLVPMALFLPTAARSESLVSGLASPAAATDAAPGANLRVRVTAPSFVKGSIVGQLAREDEKELTIERINGEGAVVKTFVVPREAVTRLEVSRARSKKGKGALIGAAFGLGASIALGVATGDETNECFLCFNKTETSAIWSVFLVPAGTLVGVLAAHGEKWEAVEPGRFHVTAGPVHGRGVQLRVALSF